MTACRSSITQSKISKVSLFCLILLLFTAIGCGDKPDEVEVSQYTSQEMTERILRYSLRLETYEKWRKAYAEEFFLNKTAMQDLLVKRSARVRGDRQEIAQLARDHEISKTKGMSANDFLAEKKATMTALEARLNSMEKEREITEQWFERDGNDFRKIWEDLIQCNRLSKTLLDHGIKDVNGLALLREHSSRLRDARRYWTAELSNAVVGAEIQGKMVDMARGTRKTVGESITPLKREYDVAISQLNGLKLTPNSIEGRIDWAEETLKQAPADDPWRIKSEPKIARYRRELAIFTEAAEKAMLTVLDASMEARKARSSILQAGNQLLKRVNESFIPEAQKRGWTLPSVASLKKGG